MIITVLTQVLYRSTRRGAVWIWVASLLVVLLYLTYRSDRIQAVHSTIFPSSSRNRDSGNLQTYVDRTSPIFPPTHNGTSDLCLNFPQEWLERVQVVLKTGVGQSEKTEAHLASASSCFRNMIIFSDSQQQMKGHNFVDILATLPAAYQAHADFAAYYKQQQAQSNGKFEASKDGWALDRFKFLPMVESAYHMRPNASWYVFLEADVYIFWDNLFRLLSQYKSRDMHYLGSAVAGAESRWFAYGGAGFVLSHALMEKLVDDGTRLTERYQQWALEDCCGDAVLGYAIFDKTGVKLEDLYPMFSGEHLEDVGINELRWCTPLISLHRMSAESLQSLWRWERTRPDTKKPLVFSDLLKYRQPFLRNTSSHEFWDNLSGNLLMDDGGAEHSLLACAEACDEDHTCLQFSYTKHQCRLWPYIVHGHSVSNQAVEFTSGWNRRKMREMGLDLTENMDPGCVTSRWMYPMVH